MKKHNLWEGILFVAAGIVFLMIANLTESRLDGLFWGLTGAGIVPGLGMIVKYAYWSSPKNSARYGERLENERIEMQDELKERVRDRSGRLAYVAEFYVVCFSLLTFSVLGMLGVLAETKVIVLWLGGYLLFQIAAGIVFFNRILKKYE